MAYQPEKGYYPAPPAYQPGPPQPQPQPQYPPHAGYPPQGYAPAPYMHTSNQNTNVVVVNQPTQPSTHTTIIERDDSPNHCLHCIITFFCPWWLFVWICICCIYGC